MVTEVLRVIILYSGTLELILHFITYFIVGFCFYILHKNPVFHLHLARIYKWMFFSYCVSQITRAVSVISYLKNIDNVTLENFNYNLFNKDTPLQAIATILRFYFLTSMYMGFVAALMERIYATIRLETYEKHVSTKFSFSCFLLVTILPGVSTYILYQEYIDFIICGLLMFFANIFGYIFLSFLHWFNEKRQSLIDATTYTLSERFQLQENLRTATSIKHISAFVFVLNGCMGSGMLAARFIETREAWIISYFVLHYFILFYGFVFPLFGIISNPYCFAIYKKLKRIFKVTPELSDADAQAQMQATIRKRVRGFTGNQMIFTTEEEKQLYFQQLQNVWN